MADFRVILSAVLASARALVILAVLTLAATLMGLKSAVVLSLVGLSVVLVVLKIKEQNSNKLIDPDAFELSVQSALNAARKHLRKTACFVVEIDDFDLLLDRHGQSAVDQIHRVVAERFIDVLRDNDEVHALSNGQFGIILGPVRKLGTDEVVELSKRLQAALDHPLSLDRAAVHVTVSIGTCLDTFVQSQRAEDMTAAAAVALADARRHGPGAIRTYNAEQVVCLVNPGKEDLRVKRGLEAGEFHAWFQPQISTDTGAVCGFEALARWNHPDRGLVSPGEFLPIVETLGAGKALGAIILRESLHAVQQWDTLGFGVEQIGVNFSQDELRDPSLFDRIVFELDAFDISARRLCVEILETVVSSSPDDTVTRNIRRLAELGCTIDLDDFGTGHTSIAAIRRFAVNRLKIDRSFVTKVDRDPEQQKMVNAIQLMAEQLGLETLAEGVETTGEHTMLAQLGCKYVQGFSIGRPMPLKDTFDWIETHNARLQTPPQIGHA